MNSMWLGIIAGLVTGLSTIVGALPILHRVKSWNPWKVLNLDFAIGMMLAASAFNLIGPAYSSSSNVLGVSLALALGVFSIYGFSHLIHKWTPTKHGKDQRAWLFVIAMMLHNLPEGLASGAALSATSSPTGWATVIAIVFQNFPEGLATAAAFLSIGFSQKKAFLGATLTGVVEIFGGTLGAVFTTTTASHLPLILAFAGGAMMNVTLGEIITNVKEHHWSYLTRKEFLGGGLAVLLLNFFMF
ncbi:Zinc transporter ZupT [compost metagenome]